MNTWSKGVRETDKIEAKIETTESTTRKKEQTTETTTTSPHPLVDFGGPLIPGVVFFQAGESLLHGRIGGDLLVKQLRQSRPLAAKRTFFRT